MSALQFSLTLIITCFMVCYEVSGISAEEVLNGDIATIWETRFAILNSSVLSFQSRLDATVLNAVNDLSFERQRRTLLEGRLLNEKEKRMHLVDRMDTLQAIVQTSTRYLAHERSIRAHVEDKLSTLQKTVKKFTLRLSYEKHTRTLLEERLAAFQKTVHNSTRRQSLFEHHLSVGTKRRMLLEDRVGILQEIAGMSYKKSRQTQLEDGLSHEKVNRTLLGEQLMDEKHELTLLEDPLDALQNTVHNLTRGLALLDHRLSHEKKTRTLLEDRLSDEKQRRALLEERLDALQAAVHNSTLNQFRKNQAEIVKVNEDLAAKPFTDCWELRTRGGYNESGVYDIYPAPDHSRLRVRCDMTTDGGGWTVLQKRYDGSVNFKQTFEKYAEGFGNVSGEHWAGLAWMHVLTSQKAVQMRVDLCTFTGQAGYAVYGGFNVSDLDDTYRLQVGTYVTGSLEERLRYHSGSVFQTTGICARDYGGGWWYRGCYDAILNGGRYNGGADQGIAWRNFGGSGWPTLRSSEMKIRPLRAPGEPSRSYTCPT